MSLWSWIRGCLTEKHHVQCPLCCHMTLWEPKTPRIVCWKCGALSIWQDDGTDHPLLLEVHSKQSTKVVINEDRRPSNSQESE